MGRSGGRARPPDRLEGQRLVHPRNGNQSSTPELPILHPDVAVPILAPEWDDPQGVPISGILFGGRRKTTVPLVTEARDWQHGVFIGATLGSEQTAAAEGKVGNVRRDPMAMLPFLGYNVGDYFQHWINLGKNADESKLPKVFFVNWFRRGHDGHFLWPGFGENSRVLKWIVERIEHRAGGRTTPIGTVPAVEDLDLDGLDVDVADVAEALKVDPKNGARSCPLSRSGWSSSVRSCPPASRTSSTRSRNAWPSRGRLTLLPGRSRCVANVQRRTRFPATHRSQLHADPAAIVRPGLSVFGLSAHHLVEQVGGVQGQ
ncbi:phosphoenolpyruvate carboxykinase family protein [Mycobacterium kansasii]|uniref:Phosphoenolpyruvate carboxykinase family protein n=1 Tax=Mycobacterium kansasii TaxID=1768 RepID=A0A1V3WP71_MYCKA|nr:phosphoenolpyruvate carboxykinase family protein [Mycobacterium kansasii]